MQTGSLTRKAGHRLQASAVLPRRPGLRQHALQRAFRNLQCGRPNTENLYTQAARDGKDAEVASTSTATSLEGLRSLRVVDLQAKLRELGLPKSGLKEDLVLRLQAALSQGQQQQQQQQGGEGGPVVSSQKPKKSTRKSEDGAKPLSESFLQGTSASKPRSVSREPSTSKEAPQPEPSDGGSSDTEGAQVASVSASTARRTGTKGAVEEPMAPKEAVTGARSSTAGGSNSSTDTNSSSSSKQQASVTASLTRETLQRVLRGGSASTSSSSSSRVTPAPTSAPGGSEGRESKSGPPASFSSIFQEALSMDISSMVGSPPAAPQAFVRPPHPPPVSGHPQLPKKASWIGHRPPGYTAVGSAANVPFQEASRPDDVTASLYPAILGPFGNFLRDAEKPVSEWERMPLPDDMPPAPASYRNESYGSHEVPSESLRDIEEFVLANSTGLSLAFLGTGHHQAMQHRAHPSLTMMRAKDVIVFDAGDDTQRQISRMAAVKMGKVFRVFITCLSSECILGLPGLLCCISASREAGHEVSDIPVHLYGPPGLTDFIDTALKVSNTYINVSIIVHEFTMRAVPDHQRGPVLVNPRARLWSVLMPPDQLNSAGFIDGNVASFMPNQGRATTSKGSSAKGGVLSSDPRAFFIPFEEPTPGDPSRTDVQPMDMRWTIRMDLEGMVTAVPLQAPRPTLGYIFREADRGGNLILERCEALGVPKGSSFGLLKGGTPVVTSEGRLVTPDMVLTPRRLGRKVIVMGSCSSAEGLLRHEEARCADVLVAGCLRTSDGQGEARSVQPGSVSPVRELLPADELGRVAAQLSARHVILSRFDWRLHGRDAHPYLDSVLARMTHEVASQLSPQQRLTAAHDMYIHIIEKHDGLTFKPLEQVQKPISKSILPLAARVPVEA